MNKFLPVITVAAIFGVLLVLFSGLGFGNDEIRFSDLETECQVSENHNHYYQLRQDDTIRFEGNYPIEHTETDLSYSYTQEGDTIRLELENTDVEEPESFEHNCLGSVVYNAETQEIEPGTYYLEIYHDGQQVEKDIIQVS